MKKAYTVVDSAKDFDPIYLPNHKAHCTDKEYKDINKDFWELISNALINADIREYIIPHRMGTLKIVKRRTNPNKRKVDFYKTKKYGRTIFHNNTHSHGYYATFYFRKTDSQALFKNKGIYVFNAVRAKARQLSSKIQEEDFILNYEG